ncbi:MAG: molecular chaperone TorD family protein [Clostridiales bacterium]|nr:molecular chaperone TorD family protein [Clostridiales bacterium]
MSMNNDYTQLMTNRESIYNLLKRLFIAEVDQPLLESLMLMEFPSGCDGSPLSEGYRMLGDYLSEAAANQAAEHFTVTPADLLTELAVDYAGVFLGAGIAEGTVACPYESVYSGSRKIMMQEARDQVTELYASKGLCLNDVGRVSGTAAMPEDHIAFELEFMAFMCREAKNSIGCEAEFLSNLKEQLDFLQKHLLNWVPAFCSDVEKLAETAFYRGLGKIASNSLSLDLTILESLISWLSEAKERQEG